MRIRFKSGQQRRFLDLVADKLRVSSIRGILQFGFNVPYPTLKSYYSESRLLPLEFFDYLCEAAQIDKNSLDFEGVEENWGKVKGGKKSKK